MIKKLVKKIREKVSKKQELIEDKTPVQGENSTATGEVKNVKPAPGVHEKPQEVED